MRSLILAPDSALRAAVAADSRVYVDRNLNSSRNNRGTSDIARHAMVDGGT